MFTGCTYKVTTAHSGVVTMTEYQIAQRYRYNIWAVHGDNIDHDEFCQNPKHKGETDHIAIAPDPFGDSSKIISSF